MKKIKDSLDTIERIAERILKAKNEDDLYDCYSDIVDEVGDIDEELSIIQEIFDLYNIDYNTAYEWAQREYITRRNEEKSD